MEAYTNNHNQVYTIEDMGILDNMQFDVSIKRANGKQPRRDYYNVAASFDIETSSWYEDGNKKACMYIWQFGINGYCFIGRTWTEFNKLYNHIVKVFNTKKTTLVVYVHNLSYEYQWIKNRFAFEKVFEVDERKPVQAITKEGIEFRCSYLLSGKSLEGTSQELFKYKVDKLHTLDYKLLRTPKTSLNDDELQYCINDIKVVMSYIQEKIELDKGIKNIPLTRTGYVRKICKDACFGKGKDRVLYSKFMNRLKLTPELYEMCKRAFQGGYVHCNPYHSSITRKKVGSFDFTSAYPTMMIAYNLFPMSSPVEVHPNSVEEFKKLLQYYACLFDITFHNIRLKKDQFCSPISVSKCIGDIPGLEEDNGRVVSADMLTTTITEQDYEVYEAFYDWDYFQIGKMYRFERGYLPKAIIDVILKLYEDKTQLKGIKDREVDYLLAKGNLNSIYGMMVTDVMKQSNSIEEYNNSFNRFNYFPWGVWTTALARKALFGGIYATGNDFIYSDTDSIKVLNYKRHLPYIEEYNEYIVKRLKQSMRDNGFDENRICPKNIEGIEKPLGVWDFEGVYDEFKAIRAKAYLSRKGKEYGLTLSGVSKQSGIDYLLSKGNPFELFKDGLEFPAGTTGKTTHTYIDEAISGTVIDCKGNKYNYKEKSCIHMEESGYNLMLDGEFIDFVRFIQTGISIK